VRGLAYSPTTNGLAGAEGAALVAEGACGMEPEASLCAEDPAASANTIVNKQQRLTKDFRQGSCIRISPSMKAFWYQLHLIAGTAWPSKPASRNTQDGPGRFLD